MKNIIIASFERKRDANFIARMIKRFRKDAQVLKGDEWDDFYLGKMIEEGMKNSREISEKEFITYLDNKIRLTQ